MDGNNFDLFTGLAQISKKNYNWYSSLSEAGKKSASPFVMARWMTGTSDAAQLVRINTFVNPYMFQLGQEKDLLFKLLSAAATGRNVRYNWIKSPGAKSGVKLKIEAIKEYYDVSTREANMYLKNISEDDILSMVDELGWEKADITALKKEFSDGSGTTKTDGTKPKKPRK